MVQSTRRPVTRGANARDINRRKPAVVTDMKVLGQPEIVDLDEKVIGAQQRVVIPRVNKCIQALRHLSQVSNDEIYRLSPAQKQNILGILRREIDDLANAFKHGRRSSRYFTLNDLLGKPGSSTEYDIDLAPPEGEKY